MVFGELNEIEGQFDGMSAEEIRTHQLECRLREFDIEVENRLEQMRVEIKLATQKLEKLYRLKKLKMPKHIREMSLSTFREEFNEDMSKVQEEKVREKLDSMDSMDMPPPPPPSTARRSGSRKRKPLGNRTNDTAVTAATTGKGSKRAKSSLNSNSRAEPTPRRSGRASSASATTTTTSRRASTRRSTRMSTAASAVAQEETAAPSSTRGSRRSTRMSVAAAAKEDAATFKTPMPPSQARGRVPAQTPALAAGLPQTPAVRQMKRGESIVSTNGSPIAMETSKMTARLQRQSSIISVPLGGKILELDGLAGIQATKGAMSSRAKKETYNHLESLQAQIASMMSALQAQ